jgi:hypothetical protein
MELAASQLSTVEGLMPMRKRPATFPALGSRQRFLGFSAGKGVRRHLWLHTATAYPNTLNDGGEQQWFDCFCCSRH